MENHEFAIELPNLIGILGYALYSTWEVAIREVVQNAHDAVHRLAMVQQQAPRGQITIRCDGIRRLIEVTDEGVGMSRDQVIADLSRIGSGESGRLRQRANHQFDDPTRHLIGQFGIGLLASFLLAEKVEVETRSHTVGADDGVRWISAGGSGFGIERFRRERPGTTMKLHMGLGAAQPAASAIHIQQRRALALAEALEPGRLERVVQRYCELLPIPIYCNDARVNLDAVPWNEPADAAAVQAKALLQRRFGKSIDDVVLIPESACDGLIGGAFFIGESEAGKQGGRIEIFVRRMFVTTSDSKILPSWARFLSGVVNAWEIVPSLDREDVKQDQAFHHARHALESALVRSFRGLAEHSPESLRRLVAAHSTIFQAALGEMPETMVALLAPVLTFNTLSGTLTLRQIAEGQCPTDGRTLLYAEKLSDARRDFVVEQLANLRYLMVPRDEAELRAMRRCIQELGEFALAPLAHKPRVTFPVSTDERWKTIRGLLAEASWLRAEVRICEFDRPELPGLVVTGGLSEKSKDRLAGVLGSRVDLAGLDHTEPGSGSAAREQFLLNATNDVCLLLAEYLQNNAGRRAQVAGGLILRAIWDMANALSSEEISSGVLLGLVRAQNALAATVLRDRLVANEAEEHEEEKVCCLLYRFDEHADGTQALVREALAGVEPGWQVIRASDQRADQEMFRNIVAMIRRASLCVVDLTGGSPNVLVELGIALALGKRIVLLQQQEADAPPSIPVDVRFLIVETYQKNARRDGIIGAIRKAVGKEHR